MSTLEKKLMISLEDSAMFIVLSHPKTYQLLNRILPAYDDEKKCPTAIGFFTVCVLFFSLNYLFMNLKKSNLSNGLMLKYSFWGTLMYFLIANKETYKLVNNVLPVANDEGCPNRMGLLAHGIVYFLSLVGIMYFPDKCNINVQMSTIYF